MTELLKLIALPAPVPESTTAEPFTLTDLLKLIAPPSVVTVPLRLIMPVPAGVTLILPAPVELMFPAMVIFELPVEPNSVISPAAVTTPPLEISMLALLSAPANVNKLLPCNVKLPPLLIEPVPVTCTPPNPILFLSPINTMFTPSSDVNVPVTIM